MKLSLSILLTVIALQLNAQTWTQLGNPPASYEARNHPVTFSIGDFAYIGTGAGNFYNPDFYRYDPSNDSWTALANFPGGARSFAYGVANAGKGYVGFGLVATSTGATYYDDLWEFDPVTNAWTKLADCPGSGRRHPAMVATPGKIFVGCGDGPNGNLNDWWEYDIASNTWDQKPNLPSFVRHHPYFFEAGGDAYVGFGHNGQSIYKDMYRYTPSTSTWTAMPDIPAQGRVAGTQFGYDGKGYLLSGQGETHNNLATGEFWEFDPSNSSWAQLTAHPGTGRWAPGSFVIGNVVYLTSGSPGSPQTDVSDLWKFDMPFAVGVNDIQKAKVQLYPNPATDEISVSTDAKIETIEVMNILGGKVQVSWEAQSEYSAVINLSTLAPGAYILDMKHTNGSTSSQQFVKRN